MQPINYILVSEIGSELLTLSDIKTHLRLDGSDYDSILTPLIKTSRLIGEKITGRDFIEKEYKTYLDYFPNYSYGYYDNYNNYEGIEIRKSKLLSITSIQYYDENNVLQTLSSSDYYITNEADYSSIFINKDKSFPNTYCRKQAVIITFKTSFPNFPQDLKQAMLSVCSYLFENTGDCVNEGNSQFKSLFFPYIISQIFLL
jgi:uncharacterized phiE125 gp8 family phage protein